MTKKKEKVFSERVSVNRIVIILLLFVLPIIFSYCFFYIQKIPLNYGEDVGESYIIQISNEAINEPCLQNSIRKIFDAPFDFNYYEVFLEDDCSNVEIDLSKDVVFNYRINDRDFKLNQCGEVSICFIQVGEYIAYPKQITVSLVAPPGQSRTFRPPNENMYATPYGWDRHAKAILFIFAWLGISLLLINSVKICKEGKLF